MDETTKDTEATGPVTQVKPEELAARRLQDNSYPALKYISCGSLNGVLVLSGCVETYHLKQVAQEVVARVPGVERIDNQIQVVKPFSKRGGRGASDGPATRL